MKKVIILSLLSSFIISITSCTTNYYTFYVTEDTPLYSSENKIATVIPKGSQVYLSTNSNPQKYIKTKWGKFTGRLYNPKILSPNEYYALTTVKSSEYQLDSISKVNTNIQPKTSSTSGGTVHVKGYYRKNGTYVKPHTRSSPKRK